MTRNELWLQVYVATLAHSVGAGRRPMDAIETALCAAYEAVNQCPAQMLSDGEQESGDGN